MSSDELDELMVSHTILKYTLLPKYIDTERSEPSASINDLKVQYSALFDEVIDMQSVVRLLNVPLRYEEFEYAFIKRSILF
jgi:hypothetical protein